MSSTTFNVDFISHRLAQLITELNVSEAESFHPLYKSDMAALKEFIELKRRLRREHGLVDARHGPIDGLRKCDLDFDYSYLRKGQAEGSPDQSSE